MVTKWVIPVLFASVSAWAQAQGVEVLQFPGPLHVEARWDTQFVVNVPASLSLRFFDPQNNATIDPSAVVSVKMWMPEDRRTGHPRHPARPTKTEVGQGSGHYVVTQMYFSMPGTWEVHVIIKRGVDVETRFFMVNVAASGSGSGGGHGGGHHRH